MIEFVTAVGLFAGVVMLLAVFIVGARSVLVPSGKVTIAINDAERVLAVGVGQKLLAALANHGVFLPSACGGRGTCGQCRVKVLEGGGTLLPTERALITPKQAADHERLACQLTVKEPLRVNVPADVLGIEQYDCTVASNRSVATFIKELVLELPAGTSLNFRAGSYVQVETPPGRTRFETFAIDDRYRAEWDRLNLWRYESTVASPEVRAYSLANHPGERDRLVLNVRLATPPLDAPEAPPGKVSSFLFALKPGDRLPVTGPFGDFFVQPTDNEMVFIGGGAGMAPMRSMILDQLLGKGTRRTMSFWYGARNRNELFYQSLFDGLATEFDNFEWHVALSDPMPSDNWQGATGFIHTVVLERYLATHPAPERCEYYLCGPPLMNAAVIKMLQDLGVEDDHIALDDFGSAPISRSRGHRHAAG